MRAKSAVTRPVLQSVLAPSRISALAPVVGSALALCAPLAAAQPLVQDGFDDGVPGPLWNQLISAPGLISVSETNGRLEFSGSQNATSENRVAVYTSNGFTIDSTQNWSIGLDFSVGTPGVFQSGDVGISVGLVFVGDVNVGFISEGYTVSIGRERFGSTEDYYAGLIYNNGDIVTVRQTERNPGIASTGRLTISYNAASDVLSVVAPQLNGSLDVTNFRQQFNSLGTNNIVLALAAYTEQASSFFGSNTWFDSFELTQEAAGPAACNVADLAPPFGIVNTTDINAFVAAFLAGCP